MKTRKALYYLNQDGKEWFTMIYAKFLTDLSAEGYEIHATPQVLEVMSSIGNNIAQPIPAEENTFSDYDVCLLDHRDPEAQKLLEILPPGILIVNDPLLQDDEFYLHVITLLSLDLDSIIPGTDKKVSEYVFGFIEAQRNLVELLVNYHPVNISMNQEARKLAEYARVNAEVFNSEPFILHVLEVGESGSSKYLSGFYSEFRSQIEAK